jgi:hypothetical protein
VGSHHITTTYSAITAKRHGPATWLVLNKPISTRKTGLQNKNTLVKRTQFKTRRLLSQVVADRFVATSIPPHTNWVCFSGRKTKKERLLRAALTGITQKGVTF